MEIASLGFRTDLMVRVLEGSEVTDHPDYRAIRTPANPEFWWGNFLLLPARAAHGEAGRWLSLFTAASPKPAMEGGSAHSWTVSWSPSWG